ncbi:PriCT-2 domain-containing protein [Bradyrhizobium sp. SRL28]|uniref:PriCT-2 domain-containing protein n=1 Tax=Bradyrhizobium sp. SRL28 TaxID=2836178 RepID=UPI001BDF5AAD|nr:PriCT-2 domain-containing protein [Bradyrhizobium sp. SRL28]MBT1509479.1 PriCT-2 domain-containing protein [Bradyrhizobium sp. SRL28]
MTGHRKKRGVTHQDIEDALWRISPDCSQDVWWRVGAAIYSALGDDGFDLFDTWSAQSETKYPGRDGCWYKWGFWRRYTVDGGDGRRPITIGTLFHFAETGGRW